MKKLLIMVAVLVVCFTGLAIAEPVDISEVLDKAPEIKEGMMYGFEDAKFKPSTSFDLVAYKDFAIELGGIAEDSEGFVALSYHVVNLKEDKGVTIWILDMIDIGVAAGYGLKEIGNLNQGEWLLGATLLKAKF